MFCDDSLFNTTTTIHHVPVQTLSFFVGVLAGSRYAPVCDLCSLFSFLLGCLCIMTAPHNTNSYVTSAPLRSNTSNKINKRLLSATGDVARVCKLM
jgi:hypothetical protein